MTIPSPCISVCVTDPGSDLCYGCARTTPEIAKWSKFTDEEKKQVIEISRSRMSGWQLEAFDKAYKEILSDKEIISVLSYIKSTWPPRVQKIHDQINSRSN